MDDRPQMNSEGEDAGDAVSDVLERRRLLKVGAYAAYTAPILLAMATSAKAVAVSVPNQNPD
jgi:hypothetical protein